MNESMCDIKNWKEVTRGFYRAVIATGACYELSIQRWCVSDEDFLKSEATLYLTGEWYKPDTDKTYFERETLFSGTVQECIEFMVSYDNELQKGE